MEQLQKKDMEPENSRDLFLLKLSLKKNGVVTKTWLDSPLEGARSSFHKTYGIYGIYRALPKVRRYFGIL